ncbi:MAG TPA: hypothetical protein PLF01_05105, partial [Alphaproteobacteria bacterium]|nr:hypothetical protein [Alphaproteobacteria bacterium]
ENIKATSIGNISYWKMTGGKNPGEVTEIDDPQKLAATIEKAHEGLLSLIKTFDNKDTPYYAIPNLDNAPRFNDYAYLERVKEWAALGENAEEAA